LLDRGLLVRAADGLHLEVTEELPLPETVQAVLAARLDTLPPEHKALLCDAAVIGETFWRGGVAALSGRAASAVEEAMTALAARDLVRPMVSASIVGEAEYIFWHALARDVAYAQLPRRVRLAKHTAAADWLEAEAGERVEELAYHYSTALDLARTTHDRERAEDLLGPVVQYLSLAADRNLALDVAAAERQYARALGLVGDDAPERPRLLARSAEALQQRGRFRESADAFLAAADGLRGQGDLPAAAAALARSWGPLNDLGDPRAQTVVADAERLLEGTPASPELVAVLTERAVEHTMCGAWRAAVASTEHALAVAAELGLDLPARALGFRGMARCLGGDAGGIDDLRRALAAAERQGLGRDAAVLQSNLGMAIALHQGVRETLGVHREGLEYAQRHGIEEFVLSFRAELIEDLTSTGGWDEALDEVAALTPVLERADFAWMLVTVRTNELQILARRGGEAVAAAPTAGLLEAARGSELPEDTIQTLFACAEAAWALGDGAQALALLTECASVPDAGAATGYAWCLAEAVRVALGAGDPTVAARLVEVASREGPMHERGLASARAALLEHRGGVDEAAAAHAAAASLWREFGDPYEEAQALLGQGRCLVALGRAPAAAAPLAAAREIFARLGARPALEETDRGLEGVDM
jgi:tetratricopeptide (TPR) repeat protein